MRESERCRHRRAADYTRYNEQISPILYESKAWIALTYFRLDPPMKIDTTVLICHRGRKP